MQNLGRFRRDKENFFFIYDLFLKLTELQAFEILFFIKKLDDISAKLKRGTKISKKFEKNATFG